MGKSKIATNLIGRDVIVRSNTAGVFFGTLVEKEGSEITLRNARKLWYWSGASTVEQISLDGVKNIPNCKFTQTVSEVIINNYDQLLECSYTASHKIRSVPEWKL